MADSLLASAQLRSGNSSDYTSVKVFPVSQCTSGNYVKKYVDVYTIDIPPSAVMILVNNIVFKNSILYPHDSSVQDDDCIPDTILTLSNTEIPIYGIQNTTYKIYYKLNLNKVQCMFYYIYGDSGDLTNGDYGINGIGFAFY